MRTTEHEVSPRTRVISGSVSAAGVVTKGTGFTVSKAATGVYVVRWSIPIRQMLNVAVTFQSGGTIVHALVDAGWGPYGFNVRTYTTVPAAVDAAFGFTATVIPR